MKLKLLLLTAITFILFSCRINTKEIPAGILNQGNLTTQTFSININRDTTLVTSSKCIIKIPKGSLESDSQNIKLDIKEALTNTDIVIAGLTTTSGKNTLSSGGMIYINAASGYKISIKKNLEVLVPTKDYNPDMSVFKGEDSAGKINWKDPAPLPKDSTILAIEYGKALFKSNCANCHKIEKAYTGPGLQGITERRKKQWIYDFIHSPIDMIQTDKDAKELHKQFGPTVMTAFPQLNHENINNVLAYIETYGNRSWKAQSDYHLNSDSFYLANKLCIDSCHRYLSSLNDLNDQKSDFENNSDDFFTLDRVIPTPPIPVERETKTKAKEVNQAPEKELETVVPTSVKATFYTINISTFGWYNIDILMKDRSECSPSELFVRLQGNYKVDFRVMLIIPSVKAFVQGGKLDDGKQYGFDETNGKIPLPQNTQCYIIAFAEADGKIISGKADFFSTQKQTINITLSETTKEGLANEIKALKLDGINADIKNSKNADKIKAIEKQSSETEKLKPVNCDCGFGETISAPNTTSITDSSR